jgi:hypothetical protein
MVVATDEVWEELRKVNIIIYSDSLVVRFGFLNYQSQSRPSAYRWRTTPFPWFDDILELLGETLQPGKYRTFGAIDEDEEPLPDTGACSSQTRADNADEEDDIVPVETVASKRHRESAAIEQPPQKKKKSSGVGAMREVSVGMQAVAEAVRASAVEKVTKDEVDSTIQGQAQLKVLEEACLTDEGHMVMVELFTDPTLARTYLAYRQKDELRAKWLKKQLEKTGGNIDALFIDWDESQ